WVPAVLAAAAAPRSAGASPARCARKLMYLPSGDHCGSLSPLAPQVIWRAAADASDGTSQTWLIIVSLTGLASVAGSGVQARMVYSTQCPSGESTGVPTLLRLMISSRVT